MSRFSLQPIGLWAKMSGPGGATNATPGPDHGNLYERSDTMANSATIAESRALSTWNIPGAGA
mgnify:CR=1 FL=1